MNTTKTNQAKICRNVMESLVNQEIEKQLIDLPRRVAQQINKVEVMAYAMNRLPSLYASSKKGLQHQIARGKTEFANQITTAVRQGLAAVQRDPLRMLSALDPQEESEQLLALDKLKDLLQYEKLSWKNVVSVVEEALIKTAQGEITWKSKHYIPEVHHNWDDSHSFR